MTSRRHSLRVRLVSAAAIFLLLPLHLGVPGVASAADTITRGRFLRDIVKALELPLDRTGDLPFENVSADLLPYVKTAYRRDALDIFGSELQAGKTIQRGEALQIAVKLLNVEAAGDPPGFSDVQAGTLMERAVAVAVERNWLKPLRSSFFGVRRVLTQKEEELLLSRIRRPAPGAKPGSDVVQPQTTKITVRVKQKSMGRGDLLDSIWDILNQDYLYKEKLNIDESAFKAAEALIQSLNDPYTVFMRPSRAKEFRSQLDGGVIGIGAQVEMKNDVLIIVSPIKGSPAEAAGLKPGDQILSVNGETLKGLNLEDAVGKVRGPKGSTARLHINRDGVEFDVNVVRDAIVIPEIDVSFQGQIAVVGLHQFGDATQRDFRAKMAAIADRDPRGLILDLRNNPGGYLNAAELVLSNFLPKGTPVIEILSRDAKDIEKTEQEPTLPDVPMVVLINKGSASASEIVAGALNVADRATIVGETSFGKGTVQRIVGLPDGSNLKMTIAEYKTVDGAKVEGVGIKPDIIIEGSDKAARDEPMLKALSLLPH